jgi:DNA-binding transcriptional regulator LsrR (DeoR family)
MMELMRNGAVGEICGWMFDSEGKLLDNPINERVASASDPVARFVGR